MPHDVEIPRPLPSVGHTRLSHRSIFVYRLATSVYQLKRRLEWGFGGKTFPTEVDLNSLPFRAPRHSSLLIRKLGNTAPQLQVAKITNLRIAASCLDGVLIRPGETFSFCKRVGQPTLKRGFVEGLELCRGEATIPR